MTALPADFRWGVATAAYQIEGSVDVDGRGASIWDDFCRTPFTIERGETGDIACDSYRRWPDDLALLQELGVTSYRFSIAWPRVMPTGSGAVNEAGLAYYERMVDDLLAAGIHPFPTLYHWDLPSALQHTGGWTSRDTAYRFADYAAVVADRLGDRVTDWTTLNEPYCSAWIGHLEGKMAPGVRDLRSAVRASHHLLLGHGLAASAVRSAAAITPSVGIVLILTPCEPAADTDADRAAAVRADGHANRWFLDPLHGRGYPADMVDLYGVDVPVEDGDLATIAAPLDFLGVNYYFRSVVADDPTVATLHFRQQPVDGAQTTEMGWEVWPRGLEEVLVRVADEYRPRRVLVTENGVAFDDRADADSYVDDPERAEYLRTHLAAVERAAQRGVPVHGYYCWSLMDNFEWAIGFRPRFGLARTDYATQRRVLKRSGTVYRDLIRAHTAAIRQDGPHE